MGALIGMQRLSFLSYCNLVFKIEAVFSSLPWPAADSVPHLVTWALALRSWSWVLLREEKEKMRFPFGPSEEEIVQINHPPPRVYFNPVSKVGTAGWGGCGSNPLETCDGGGGGGRENFAILLVEIWFFFLGTISVANAHSWLSIIKTFQTGLLGD